MLIFAAVILSAILFDAFHQSQDSMAKETHQHSESHDLQASHVFYFNSISNFKLRSGVDKLFSGLVFSGCENELLAEYHNNRTFHLLKAESLHNPVPFMQMAHFMKFNSCHHICPDDYHLGA